MNTDLLQEIATTVPLGHAADVAVQVLGGKVRGRTVVDVNA